MRKVRIYKVEILDGIYKSIIGKTIQVNIPEDLTIGSEIQVREYNLDSMNIKAWNSDEYLHFIGDSFCVCKAMLAKVTELVWSFDDFNGVRENQFCTENYDHSKTVSAKVFDLRNKNFASL